MLPLAGKPVLEHLICWLRVHGVKDIAINLHHLPQVVMNYFGDGRAWDVRLTYSVEETLLGTAGAVRRLHGFFDEPFVVVYGDLLTDVHLGTLIQFHHQIAKQDPRTLGTLALYRVPNPSACGIVELDGSQRIRRFVEKPQPDEIPGNLANAGIYVLDPAILDAIPPEISYDFGHDLFPQLLIAGVSFYGYPIAEYLLDVGTLEKYRQAEGDIAAGRVRLAGEVGTC
jgi:NDP-sugar pyrophosphorylase family protein